MTDIWHVRGSLLSHSAEEVLSALISDDRKNYDKLNRVHYKEAKLKNMKPANFIMTELIS